MILNVKPSLALKTAVSFALACILGACGQTGPLYLPKKPATPVQPSGATAIAPTTTVSPPPSN